MYTSVSFRIFLNSFSHNNNQLVDVTITQRESQSCFRVIPCFLLTLTVPGNLTYFLYLSRSACSSKEFTQLCLGTGSFSYHSAFKVHSYRRVYQHYSFLCKITFPCMDRPHVFIHSPVEEHLVWFYFWFLWVRLLWARVCVHVYLHSLLGVCWWNCWSYNSSVLNSPGFCLANSHHSCTTNIPTNNKNKSPSFTVSFQHILLFIFLI